MDSQKDATESLGSLRCSSYACDVCNGEGGRWDDESQAQWYWCDNCDAGDKHYEQARAMRKKQESRASAFAASFLHIKACQELDAPNEHSLYLVVGDQRFNLGIYGDEYSAQWWKSMWAKALGHIIQQSSPHNVSDNRGSEKDSNERKRK